MLASVSFCDTAGCVLVFMTYCSTVGCMLASVSFCDTVGCVLAFLTYCSTVGCVLASVSFCDTVGCGMLALTTFWDMVGGLLASMAFGDPVGCVAASMAFYVGSKPLRANGSGVAGCVKLQYILSGFLGYRLCNYSTSNLGDLCSLSPRGTHAVVPDSVVLAWS